MPLDAGGARRSYDRIGRWQDTQRFYEDPAIRRLVDLAAFDAAHAIVEVGCGTGRLAATLLGSVVPADARYLGVDVSPVMVRLATSRLAPWAGRASAQLLDPPALTLPAADAAFDRVLATYVLDLLTPENATALISEAVRLLAPGGLLGVVSLTHGITPASRVVCSVWSALAARWPGLVGGCRPIEVTDLLTGPDWTVQHQQVLVRFGVPSEVVLAQRT